MNHPGTKTLHTTSDAYKYLHRDFHMSMALGLQYIDDHYGNIGLQEYLTQFTLAFHKPLLAKIKESGLPAIAEYLTWLYTVEEAEDALDICVSEDAVDVTIHYCPAVKHLKSRGYTPQHSFEQGTSVVYGVLAKEGNLNFEMVSYDHDTGAAHYIFRKP